MLSLVIWLLLLGVSVSKYRPDYSDLPGPYCRTRPNSTHLQCCPDRLDECSVSVLGTLCYCDAFCDRSASGDCCPDYFSFCLGEPPPTTANASCSYNNVTLAYGESVMNNCNKCSCSGPSAQPVVVCETEPCLVSPDLVEATNRWSNVSGWTASNHSRFWGRTLADGLRYLLGTDYPTQMIRNTYPVTKVFRPAELPAQFDARTKWPGLVGPVVTQGWCGASWAVSTATTAADRLSIQRGRRIHLSAQNVLDCARPPARRHCLGGPLDVAWNFLRRRGVSSSQCYPYTSGDSGRPGACLTAEPPSGAPGLTCEDGSGAADQRQHLYGMQPPYRVARDEADIRHEIYHNGPVQAILRVQRDLFVYSSGVYVAGADDLDSYAYHSVRILGWGEQSLPSGHAVKYWLVANSWGVDWGERGLLRIRRATNEADIETFVVGAWAQSEHLHQTSGRGASVSGDT